MFESPKTEFQAGWGVFCMSYLELSSDLLRTPQVLWCREVRLATIAIDVEMTV